MDAVLRARSVCECQATLVADLNEDCLVVSASAKRRRVETSASANRLGEGERFDLAWHCPMCGRNTLRTFHRDALVKLHAAP